MIRFGDGIKQKFVKEIGNNSATSFVVTHGFDTKYVQVEVYDDDGATVLADVTRSGDNQVTVGFAYAPASNDYTVVVTA